MFQKTITKKLAHIFFGEEAPLNKETPSPCHRAFPASRRIWRWRRRSLRCRFGWQRPRRSHRRPPELQPVFGRESHEEIIYIVIYIYIYVYIHIFVYIYIYIYLYTSNGWPIFEQPVLLQRFFDLVLHISIWPRWHSFKQSGSWDLVWDLGIAHISWR